MLHQEGTGKPGEYEAAGLTTISSTDVRMVQAQVDTAATEQVSPAAAHIVEANHLTNKAVIRQELDPFFHSRAAVYFCS